MFTLLFIRRTCHIAGLANRNFCCLYWFVVVMVMVVVVAVFLFFVVVSVTVLDRGSGDKVSYDNR